MQWKEIELSDIEIFQKAFDNIDSQASEMTFANMFMWRSNYNTRFSIINDMLCMISNSRAYKPFAFTPIPLDSFKPEAFTDTVYALKDYFESQGWDLFFGRVEERMADLFKKHLDIKVRVKKNEAVSDYVYRTERLMTLSGKKLSSKRNHINRFMREYGDFEYVEISRETVPECKRIFEEWCEKMMPANVNI